MAGRITAGKTCLAFAKVAPHVEVETFVSASDFFEYLRLESFSMGPSILAWGLSAAPALECPS